MITSFNARSLGQNSLNPLFKGLPVLSEKKRHQKGRNDWRAHSNVSIVLTLGGLENAVEFLSWKCSYRIGRGYKTYAALYNLLLTYIFK